MKDVERMLVSAHEDGEVGTPWNAELDRRIAADPDWAAEASLHRSVKAVLAADPEPDFAEARRRVADRLAARTSGGRDAAGRTSRFTSAAWLSVAAAALLIAAGAAGFWVGRQSVVPGASADLAELQVKVPKPLGLKLTGEGQLLLASTTERAAP